MNNRQEATPRKWKSKIKKWIGGIIILGIISGVYWLFSPLMWAKSGIFWDRVNLGEHKTMKDVYYVNISGITYLNNKFYILLYKPYIFNPNYLYIYSSSNLLSWNNEFYISNYSRFMVVDSDIKYDVITESGFIVTHVNGERMVSDEIAETSMLPFMYSGSCYIRYYIFSAKCSTKWEKLEKSFNDLIIESIPEYPSNNEKAYSVINKINKSNNLNLAIGVAHTTYGDGKYVGVFYKNKQYYFIISTDGINYKIEPAPSELTGSLAIKLFN